MVGHQYVVDLPGTKLPILVGRDAIRLQQELLGGLHVREVVIIVAFNQYRKVNMTSRQFEGPCLDLLQWQRGNHQRGMGRFPTMYSRQWSLKLISGRTQIEKKEPMGIHVWW